MFLHPAADSPAAAGLFQSDLDARGYVMNLSRLWAWRPEVHSGFAALRTLLTGASALSKRELGVLVCATASSLGDSYCSLAWGKLLADAADPAAAAGNLRGHRLHLLSAGVLDHQCRTGCAPRLASGGCGAARSAAGRRLWPASGRAHAVGLNSVEALLALLRAVLMLLARVLGHRPKA